MCVHGFDDVSEIQCLYSPSHWTEDGRKPEQVLFRRIMFINQIFLLLFDSKTLNEK